MHQHPNQRRQRDCQGLTLFEAANDGYLVQISDDDLAALPSLEFKVGREGGGDGWMGGWVDGWMDGWMGGWMGGWVDGWMDGWMCVWMEGWVGGGMGGCMCFD